MEIVLKNKYNWFERYAVAEKILIEAGWKEGIITGLLGALLMILSGSTISAAAKRFNIPENKIEEAMSNPSIMDRIYQINKEKTFDDTTPQISINDFINAILTHEGLLEGQTPFRITNPKMREWNTIHGFQIDKETPIPQNRRNFIFLRNPHEVPLAVKKQFENYVNYPSRYGMNQSPTIEEAIRIFDQTGADGKIRFLKRKFPNINLQLPLSELTS